MASLLPLTAQTPPPSIQFSLAEIEGKVEFRAAGTALWLPARVNQTLKTGDWLRTGERSRMAIRLGESVIRQSELTTIEIEPSPPGSERPTLNVKSGLLYFFGRDRRRELQLRTPLGAGATRGTEFGLLVASDGTTMLTLIDGEVELTNEHGTTRLSGGEVGRMAPGQAPAKTALLQSEQVQVIQWCLYYPAVLDLAELPFNVEEQQALAASITAYRAGDLLQALANYPWDRGAASPAERIFQSALMLSVGQIAPAERLLTEADHEEEPRSAAKDGRLRPLIHALRTLVAAVKYQPPPEPGFGDRDRASVQLAESYFRQSESDLAGALVAARKAAALDPSFGSAWARVAELEFCFGRIPAARQALEKSLTLAPQNAQALALRGFLLCAGSQWAAALRAFDQATATDGALANAWLGRGLVRIHSGDLTGGRADLEMAAALEPNRALLRAYLGKAFHEERDFARAGKELGLAKGLDPRDPTAWLYSALLNRDLNRFNEAVAELEESQNLNTNRGLFRSKLLLDQDQAVRGANLAAIYRDNGMSEVAVREAGRAVNDDPANEAAHLFLANSYDALRDPRQVSLRYETPWFNELLLANLLAPPGAGSLSQMISQQEYSRLFERNHLGISSATEYLSGAEWQTHNSQYGTFGKLSYALDAAFLSQNGRQVNGAIEQSTFYGKIKEQLGPQDALFFETIYYRNKSGDVRQYYDPSWPDPSLRFQEVQEPNLFVGYHREWAPGSHTLLLAGRLDDQVTLRSTDSTVLTLARNPDGSPRIVRAIGGFAQDYRSALEAYTIEAQQIWQQDAHTVVAGSRFQTGVVDTDSSLSRDPTRAPANLLGPNPVTQSNATDLERLSLYSYYQWRVVEPLRLIAGLGYDRLVFPVNVDLPPIADGNRSKDQVSPKAGFIWTIAPRTHFQGAYTRSLGGLYYDTSVRLEPTQVAGLAQTFRSAIPESVAGLIPGSRFESAALLWDHEFKSRTYLGLEGQLLYAKADRDRGVFDWPGGFPVPPALPSSVSERLDYREPAFAATLNQLLGDEWALGVRYRLSHAQLDSTFPDLPPGTYTSATATPASTLQQVSLGALFNHRRGAFARVEADWYAQRNQGYASDRPGDDFWQFNLFLGYRFPRRLAEVSLGLLNLAARDYRLNPLNLYPDLPRTRTLVVRLKFDF